MSGELLWENLVSVAIMAALQYQRNPFPGFIVLQRSQPGQSNVLACLVFEWLQKRSSDIIVSKSGSLGSCTNSVSLCPQPEDLSSALSQNYLFCRRTGEKCTGQERNLSVLSVPAISHFTSKYPSLRMLESAVTCILWIAMKHMSNTWQKILRQARSLPLVLHLQTLGLFLCVSNGGIRETHRFIKFLTIC